jgi:hypothetical protein
VFTEKHSGDNASCPDPAKAETDRISIVMSLQLAYLSGYADLSSAAVKLRLAFLGQSEEAASRDAWQKAWVNTRKIAAGAIAAAGPLMCQPE